MRPGRGGVNRSSQPILTLRFWRDPELSKNNWITETLSEGQIFGSFVNSPLLLSERKWFWKLKNLNLFSERALEREGNWSLWVWSLFYGISDKENFRIAATQEILEQLDEYSQSLRNNHQTFGNGIIQQVASEKPYLKKRKLG